VTGRPFRTSTDNLNGTPTDSRPFRRAVQLQAQRYLTDGLPARAKVAVRRLCNQLDQAWPQAYCFSELPR